MPTLFLITAILLYVFGTKKESIKWLIFTSSFASLYDLTHLIINIALPAMHSYNSSESLIFITLTKMLPVIVFLHGVFTPYGVLVFTIVLSELTSRRTKNILAYVLTLPIFIMVAAAVVNHHLQLDFMALILWAAPYYLAACFLLIFVYLKEKNPKKKKLRLIAAWVMVPSTLVNLVTYNVARAFDLQIDGYWYLFISGTIAFVVFILLVVRSGVFGVRIKFEKQLLDHTITGIASGTSMLNHALKNRIINIDMLALRMHKTSKLLHYQYINDDVIHILAETKQMMQMVKRIQKQIEEVEIIEATDHLNEIVRHALQSNQHLLESKRISVTVNDLAHFQILCDKVHLQEVFNNMLRNAIDAVEAVTGVLTITIYDNKRSILIAFTDNGRGVADGAISKIFDPFYSTKHNEDNFGLGLSYCYIIVRKHGGKIEVASNEQIGSTFTVHLPKYRIV